MDFHGQTSHSYISVRKNANFLDWSTQPKSTKEYPGFCKRYGIDEHEALKDLELIGGVTYTQQIQNGHYNLRTVPSAGALYPCEVYLQIRGIKGILPGIYHYEPLNQTITLLQEVEKDGVEFYFSRQKMQKGITFLISAVYFRSSWKYGNRSIRYILLDSGHQLGTIYSYLSLKEDKSTAIFDFDKAGLNETFGFRNDEMFTVGICTENSTDKTVSDLRQELFYVNGSDYLETNSFIENAYKKSGERSYDEELPGFFEGISKEDLKKAILNRRSIRAFRKMEISKEELDRVTKDLFVFALDNSIEIFYTVHRVDKAEQGLYKNGEFLKKGDFSQKSRYLALKQNIGGDGAVTFFFTSSEATDYQKVNILSGFIAHIIYLRSEVLGIGTTGIGAYYDDEVKEFLGTENNILYMLAIGR